MPSNASRGRSRRFHVASAPAFLFRACCWRFGAIYYRASRFLDFCVIEFGAFMDARDARRSASSALYQQRREKISASPMSPLSATPMIAEAAHATPWLTIPSKVRAAIAPAWRRVIIAAAAPRRRRPMIEATTTAAAGDLLSSAAFADAYLCISFADWAFHVYVGSR